MIQLSKNTSRAAASSESRRISTALQLTSPAPTLLLGLASYTAGKAAILEPYIPYCQEKRLNIPHPSPVLLCSLDLWKQTYSMSRSNFGFQIWLLGASFGAVPTSLRGFRFRMRTVPAARGGLRPRSGTFRPGSGSFRARSESARTDSGSLRASSGRLRARVGDSETGAEAPVGGRERPEPKVEGSELAAEGPEREVGSSAQSLQRLQD